MPSPSFVGVSKGLGLSLLRLGNVGGMWATCGTMGWSLAVSEQQAPQGMQIVLKTWYIISIIVK